MVKPEECHHRFIFDPENQEIVCERGCGWVISIFEDKAREYAPAGRKLTSPSVKDMNLGSNQDDVIKDLRKGAVDPTTGKRTYILSGRLKFFGGNGHSKDQDRIVELSDRLHGRVNGADLAAIAAIYRTALAKHEKEKRAKAVKLLDQMTGRDGS